MERRLIPVIPAPQRDMERIALLRARYPQGLPHNHRTLRGISAKLAASPDERRQFLLQPGDYLTAQGIALNDASLVRLPAMQMQTSEACTWLAICAYAVAAAVAWLVVAVGSYEIYSFVHCSNLAWGNCIKDDQLSPFYPRMTSSVV
jgi:hypothetical protein